MHKKTRNGFLKAACFMLAAMALSAFAVCGTLAKYTSKGTFRPPTLTVATWKFKVNEESETFPGIVALSGLHWTVAPTSTDGSETSDNTIAPCTWGYAAITVQNVGDVDAYVTVSGVGFPTEDDAGNVIKDTILNKLARRNLPLTVESIEQNLNDMAGIRVVCSYIDDIYKLAESFLAQDDITLLERKDYIENPKPNGYRSLHLIVSVPVFFSEEKRDMKVEVQIRTIAMDFWASLEHQMKYKKAIPDQDKIIAELKRCADVISNTDQDMLTLRKHIEAVQDEPTEEEILFEKLRQINKPI